MPPSCWDGKAPLELRAAFCAVHCPPATAGGVTYQTSGPPFQSTKTLRRVSKSMPYWSSSGSEPPGTTKYERLVGPGCCRLQTTKPQPMAVFAVLANSLRDGSYAPAP